MVGLLLGIAADLTVGDHGGINGCFQDQHERRAEHEGTEEGEEVRDPRIGKICWFDSKATSLREQSIKKHYNARALMPPPPSCSHALPHAPWQHLHRL